MTVHILGINGSLRRGSTADRALSYFLPLLQERGARCETFEIGGLPALDGRADDSYPPSVAAWRAAAGSADGFVFTEPSFHGGMPGAFKNALDFLGIDQVGGKPFALIGVAMGDAEPGVTDTSRVMRHIGGVAGVMDIVISRSGQHWGPEDAPANEAITAAMRKVAEDLVAFCQLRADGRLPGA